MTVPCSNTTPYPQVGDGSECVRCGWTASAHPKGPAIPPRLLVLRALGLGDLLTAVPALRALRRAHPGHELVLAAPARTAEAAAATGAVDRLLPTTAAGRAVPARIEWAGPPPDIAVDLHGNGPPSHLLLATLQPGRLLAYAHPDTPWITGPAWRADEHERPRWCRLLTWYGIPADPDDLRIPAPEAPSSAPGCVVVHPGADSAARRWPAERFAAVARGLRAAGHRIVVTAGAGEGRLGHEVARQAGLPSDDVLGGEDDVPFSRLAALVAHARAVVVGDTGLGHLATALGTPSVVLFGPVSPRLWGPPPSPMHRVLWHPDEGDDDVRPGDPHGDRPDERLLRITVHEVLDALERLPQRQPSGPPDDRPSAPRVRMAEGRL
ncbi:glycosyltransferase family 9 protein [Streptomyces jeddahensis]|uniref:Lipopolysaccharide core heptosyltransferase RfaQ n=1 Tax=Streptomyces jeddahensis TaxID=1716141 RepID=A0A177HRB2_9ACTN|nr:glycosyltransferase family 9 protein [Streptomyces jeddahensis]OAH12708.1 lipopolysaccharide core heptosyltransferase RfaQ [Streptomyces jeddahensis]